MGPVGIERPAPNALPLPPCCRRRRQADNLLGCCLWCLTALCSALAKSQQPPRGCWRSGRTLRPCTAPCCARSLLRRAGLGDAAGRSGAGRILTSLLRAPSRLRSSLSCRLERLSAALLAPQPCTGALVAEALAYCSMTLQLASAARGSVDCPPLAPGARLQPSTRRSAPSGALLPNQHTQPGSMEHTERGLASLARALGAARSRARLALCGHFCCPRSPAGPTVAAAPNKITKIRLKLK